MKNYKFLIILAVLAIAGNGLAADNIYIAPPGQTVTTDTKAPAALTAVQGADGSFALTTGENVAIVQPAIVTTATYGANSIVGGKLTLSGVTRDNGGTAFLSSLTVVDKSNQKRPMTLLVFDTATLTGTYTDAATTAVVAADAARVVSTISIASSDWTTVDGTNAVATIPLNRRAIQLTGSNSASALLYTGSAAGFATGTNGALILKLGVSQN